MNFQPSIALLASILALTCPGSPLGAQGAAAPAGSLQAQVDDLRRGQEQLQKDLAEIKALLKERAARVDAPAARPRELTPVNVYGEPFKGAPSARVAIMEYSDFDCAYCAKYATTILPLIDEVYLKAGKVKYFFRDLPLTVEHPNALFKAQLARCAGDQNGFWEAHDHLFRNQRPFDDKALAQFSRELVFDEAKLKACLSGGSYLDAIQRSVGSAARMGINGTPAFLIGTLSEDGRLLQPVKVFLGADSFEAFRNVLDDLLKPAAPPPTGSPGASR